jgi:hypothetical protein
MKYNVSAFLLQHFFMTFFVKAETVPSKVPIFRHLQQYIIFYNYFPDSYASKYAQF